MRRLFIARAIVENNFKFEADEYLLSHDMPQHFGFFRLTSFILVKN